MSIKLTYKNLLTNDESQLSVRSGVAMSDIGAMVRNTVSQLFANGEYHPYLFRYVFYTNLISLFTDYDTDISADDMYLTLVETDIVNAIENSINPIILFDIKSSVEELISIEKKKISGRSEFDFLISDIRELLSDFASTVDFEEIAKMLPKLSRIEKITDKQIFELISGGKAKGAPKPKSTE